MVKNKRDIDKEIMYRKIMPSAAKIRGAAGGVENRIKAEAIEEKAHAIISGGAESLHQGVAKTHLFPTAIAGLPSSRQKILVNLVEYAVKDKLEEAFMKFNCCKCDKCKMDVVALTLNKMTPKYVVIHQDEIEEVIRKNAFDVVPSIIKAIIEVKAKPRH